MGRDPHINYYKKRPKKGYERYSEALEVAERQSRNASETWHVYTCPQCQFFHVGRESLKSAHNERERERLREMLGLRAYDNLERENGGSYKRRYRAIMRRYKKGMTKAFFASPHSSDG